MHYITALWRKIEHELPPAFNIHTHTEERFAQLRCFFEASRTMSVIFIVNNSFLFWMHGYVVKCIDIVIELWENMRTHCRSCFLRKLLSSPLWYDKIGTESVAARDWSKVCHICDCFIYLSKWDIYEMAQHNDHCRFYWLNMWYFRSFGSRTSIEVPTPKYAFIYLIWRNIWKTYFWILRSSKSNLLMRKISVTTDDK